MFTKTVGRQPGTLGETLPGATFGEWHHGIVDADIDSVWHRLQRVRWSDLRLSRVALVARGFGIGPGLERGCLETFAPHAVFAQTPPVEVAFAMVGKPWSPVPVSEPVATLDEVADYRQPGWLKYGMDWRLTELPDGRTLVETSTLCEPTDATARRRFTAYWLLIRPWSGLIRREMIETLKRPEHPR